MISVRRITAAATLAAVALLAPHAGAQTVSPTTRAAADRLIDAALTDTLGYGRLAYMGDTFGNRLSGSGALEQAIDWMLGEMKRDGLANVRGEPAMVPHWVRGEESADLVQPRAYRLHMLGLGNSVGTPTGGITAPVVVVSSFDELDAHKDDVKGKIVLFDHPFPTDVKPMDGYGQAVAYRAMGPSRAAKYGAAAVLIRSIETFSIQSPHTGSLRYDTTVAKIPAAALSIEDAELLHRLYDRGQKPVVTLRMNAQMLPDAPSRNVVAEVRGSEKPDEVVVLGGHIDSWDVGEGMMDDGGGVLAAWEAVRLMNQLGLHPKRTVRVVAWVNEENGGRGGRAYLQAHQGEVARTVAAMESDEGTFRPNGFEITGTDSAVAFMRRISTVLARLGADTITTGEGEADVGPLLRAGVPGLGLQVDDSKYFWYHHTTADMPNVVNRDEFNRCIAVMAAMAYTLADIDAVPPHGTPATR